MGKDSSRVGPGRGQSWGSITGEIAPLTVSALGRCFLGSSKITRPSMRELQEEGQGHSMANVCICCCS